MPGVATIDVLHILLGELTATRLTIDPRLTELQRLVGGQVESLGLHQAGTVYIDEEGKERRLPRNIAVELLFDAAGQTLLPGDFIAGPALITGGYGPGGEDLGVDDDVLALCRRARLTVVDGPVVG